VREIVDEQAIYKRERQTGLKIPSYVFSKLAVLAFIALVQCTSVVGDFAVCAPRAGAKRRRRILGSVAIMFLVAVNGTLIGLGNLQPGQHARKGPLALPAGADPELLLSGLFLPVRPIQTMIPITVDQLFQGELFAQPEAKAKAAEMIKKSQDTSAAPTTATAQQVAGAIKPSAEVEKEAASTTLPLR